jgi:hypothetical protein
MIRLELVGFASVVGPSIYVIFAWRRVIGWRFSAWIKGYVFPLFSVEFLHT